MLNNVLCSSVLPVLQLFLQQKRNMGRGEGDFISKFLISNFQLFHFKLLTANMFNMEGRHLVNVFDSDSNISKKDPQNQDLFEDANHDNDQISVSSDGSVSLALSNSDVNDSDNSIGNKDGEVDGKWQQRAQHFSTIQWIILFSFGLNRMLRRKIDTGKCIF